MFWKTAKSSTMEEFNVNMEEIKAISPIAHEYLLKTKPRYWSMAFFCTLTTCDMVTNNLSVCFNSWIVEASMNKNPEDAVDMCYSKSVYMEAYSHLLRPMNGSLYWPHTELPDILPPKTRRMPGRPKKSKKKGAR
ncbi:hypothetical protein POM88_028532 [Heracleum sosnowskyi]|uniref:Uncharacterized protein n=1 Tax=Heracleum sosnowskyi TaxID=360622 RepID=A0AAD8HS49_9APIA|nr:hypothetical protein POM88_028528 [Heracleum sosnowskyi]KAK1372339.1 hypothetical protein POM88_028532 [Heracleum sosnowskyi]